MSTTNEHSVRDRVFAAADELYEAGNRQSFPTVDAVRKKARVNMNDASVGMREWRRTRTGTPTTVQAPLPGELQGRAVAVMSEFWHEASRLANESLLAAQAGWEAERNESEDLNRQLASAYDAQAAELAAAQAEIEQLKSRVGFDDAELAKMTQQLAATAAERDQARQALGEASAAIAEARRRADDLQQAVAYAREDAVRARAEAEALRASYSDQIERMRGDVKRELEAERARWEHERHRYEEVANRAATDAARLQGMLDAFNTSAPPTPARRSPSVKKRPNGGAGTEEQKQ